MYSRLSSPSFIANKDWGHSLSVWSASTTHNPYRDFILYQFTRCVAYADFSSDIIFFQAQIASFNSDQCTAFNRTTEWFDLGVDASGSGEWLIFKSSIYFDLQAHN